MRYFSMFTGAGGFEIGIQAAIPEAECVGFSEIDKYAIQVLRLKYPEVKNYGDATKINPNELPDFELLCGGFPCQSFSMAGNRGGFDDARGTLFYEIARIAKIKKPKILFLENVKGLLSHEEGRTFATILKALDELGYDAEWQLLNSRYWVPQNRERIFIIGHIRGESWLPVFPIGGTTRQATTKRLKEVTENESQGYRVYEPEESSTIAGQAGGVGAKTGLYMVGEIQQTCKKRTQETPVEINEFLKQHKGQKTLKEIAAKVELPETQVAHYFRTDEGRAIPNPEIWLKLKELLKFDNRFDKNVTEFYEKEVEFESNRRVYSDKGIVPTLSCSEAGKMIQTEKKVIPTQLGGSEKRGNAEGSDIAYTLRASNPNGIKVQPAHTFNLSMQGRRFKENNEDSFTLNTLGEVGVMVHNFQPRSADRPSLKKNPKSGGHGFLQKEDEKFCLDTGGMQGIEVKIGDYRKDDGTRIRKDKISPTLTSHGDTQGGVPVPYLFTEEKEVKNQTRIRRLTPIECERLQAFPDGWTKQGRDEEGNIVEISDSQRYKLMGNAVTTKVIQAIAERIWK